jgi:uncharacterized protein (DUF697 family)
MPRSKKSTIQNNPLEQISRIADSKQVKSQIKTKKPNSSKKVSIRKSLAPSKKTSTASKKEKVEQKKVSVIAPATPPSTQKRGAEEVKRDLQALSKIKKWSRIASACALPPLPLLATAASSGVQITMIKDLCTIYDVPFHKELVKATISSILGSGTALFSMGYLAKELLRGIPYAGNTLLILTQPAAIYKLTSSLGTVFMRHFQNQGDLTNLDLTESRLLLKNQLK